LTQAASAPAAATRIGFFGAGLIATYHSKSLRVSGEAYVPAGVYDPEPGRAEAFAAASGHTACASEDAVLDGCDAVYICTWTSEHPRLVAAAAERGLAVFCEKPLATSLADARAMCAVVEQAGIVNQVGLVLRSSPAFLWARSLVTAEAAGRVMAVVFRDDQYIPVQGMYGSTWRSDRHKAGAGTMIEHSIHDLDVIEWLAGPVATVAATSSAFHGIDGIEDAVAVTLRFDSGAVGTLASVWHDLLSRPSLRRVEVLCERAWVSIEGDWFGPVRWQTPAGDFSLEGPALVEAATPLDPNGGNPDGAFLRAVRNGRPAEPGFTVALRAHSLVDAVYRSAGTGGSAAAPT
jgi:predicted dehydrogenase